MNAIQLDFFKTEEECELDSLRKSIESIRVSSDKVRRGTYARLNIVSKECAELKADLEIIKMHLCKGVENE